MKKRLSKLAIIFISLILLIFTGLIIYKFSDFPKLNFLQNSPTSSKTSNNKPAQAAKNSNGWDFSWDITNSDIYPEWRKYTNVVYNFSIDYPINNFVTEIKQGNPNLFFIQYCSVNEPVDCTSSTNIFEIEVFDNPDNKSVSDWIKSDSNSDIYKNGDLVCQLKDPRSKTSEDLLNQNTNILEYSFIVDEQTKSTYCKNTQVGLNGLYQYAFVKRGAYIYKLSVLAAEENVFLQLNKILSTFKFVN